jgi:hypothetical protein
MYTLAIAASPNWSVVTAMASTVSNERLDARKRCSAWSCG